MRLTLEIRTFAEGRTAFGVFDDKDPRNAGITGSGWTITDAVDDFIANYNAGAFYDDDTPTYISRSDIELKRPRLSRNACTRR